MTAVCTLGRVPNKQCRGTMDRDTVFAGDRSMRFVWQRRLPEGGIPSLDALDQTTVGRIIPLGLTRRFGSDLAQIIWGYSVVCSIKDEEYDVDSQWEKLLSGPSSSDGTVPWYCMLGELCKRGDYTSLVAHVSGALSWIAHDTKSCNRMTGGCRESLVSGDWAALLRRLRDADIGLPEDVLVKFDAGFCLASARGAEWGIRHEELVAVCSDYRLLVQTRCLSCMALRMQQLVRAMVRTRDPLCMECILALMSGFIAMIRDDAVEWACKIILSLFMPVMVYAVLSVANAQKLLLLLSSLLRMTSGNVHLFHLNCTFASLRTLFRREDGRGSPVGPDTLVEMIDCLHVVVYGPVCVYMLRTMRSRRDGTNRGGCALAVTIAESVFGCPLDA